MTKVCIKPDLLLRVNLSGMVVTSAVINKYELKVEIQNTKIITNSKIYKKHKCLNRALLRQI